MTAPDPFVSGLRDVLAHLFDPAYSFPPSVQRALGPEAEAVGLGARAIIIRAIDRLRPDSQVPYHARAWRLYRVLSLRYLEQLSQAEAAERLAMSVRHLAREQAEAIELLARQLSQPIPTRDESTKLDREAVGPQEQPAVPDPWRQQVATEIASFQRHATMDRENLQTVISKVGQFVGVLAAEHDVSLHTDRIDEGLVVDMHPAILSQIVLAPVTYMVRGMTGGQVEVTAEEEGGEARITVTGRPLASLAPPADSLASELLASLGGRLSYDRKGDRLAVSIMVPLGRTKVLIVDDNEDLVYMYRRCLSRTRYSIVSLPHGSQALGSIETVRPEAIVLDLMLPDVDGWALLAELHEHPSSRDIPVIVCSVVREEDLALALGATAYLPKPVQCKQLIAALDQAIFSRDGARGPIGRQHTAQAC